MSRFQFNDEGNCPCQMGSYGDQMGSYGGQKRRLPLNLLSGAGFQRIRDFLQMTLNGGVAD